MVMLEKVVEFRYRLIQPIVEEYYGESLEDFFDEVVETVNRFNGEEVRITRQEIQFTLHCWNTFGMSGLDMKPPPEIKIREILRLHARGESQRMIVKTTQHGARLVARVIQESTAGNIVYSELNDTITDADLYMQLFPPVIPDVILPNDGIDYVHVLLQLNRKGLTLMLLWEEYKLECYDKGESPCAYTTFCERIRKYRKKLRKPTMHIPRYPGERIEVDYMGQEAQIVDKLTGEVTMHPIFVATLTYSKYFYIEICESMSEACWIQAHINAFEFFGGVTTFLIPDNCKTATTGRKDKEAIIQKDYKQLSEYYQISVMPTDIRSPRQKSAVEASVRFASTRILARLRDETFYDLESANEAFLDKLNGCNERPFSNQPKGETVSRYSLFLDEEQSTLHPLPSIPYELVEWKKLTVHPNYHVKIEYNWYSVPSQYLSEKVDVSVSKTMIKVFRVGKLIAEHKKENTKRGQYITCEEHRLKEKHKALEVDRKSEQESNEFNRGENYYNDEEGVDDYDNARS